MLRIWCGVGLALLLGCGSNPEHAAGSDISRGGAGSGGGGSGGEGARPTDIDVDSGTGGSVSDPSIACGDGKLEAGERCDDGNTSDGDGCAADCLAQDPNYDCSTVGQPCLDTVICGNGVIEGDEHCDDGNTDGADGCSADCSDVEEGFGCSRPGKPCVELPQCGNGERERGEQCDDGQQLPEDGDGCSATCQREEGFWCPTPGLECSALECGDNVRTPDEACDDGQSPPLGGDGCSSVCQVELGWRCSDSGCVPVCGDGLVRGAEQCDDENRTSRDGCSAGCKVEPFYACDDAEPSVCVETKECGNGELEPEEVCDPPGEDGCAPGCQSFAPPGSTCGNSIIETGEECDAPSPGNGCANGCAVEEGFTCPRPNVCFELPYCGDGILHASLGEECDDGNGTSSDGCSSCAVTNGWSCHGLEPSVCVQEICGNGLRTPNEECDDGNADNDDGCSGCDVDIGWACPYQNQDCIPRCGDGLKVGDEQCDDGDTASADGCNAGCRIEPGYVCPNVDQDCVPSACGNSAKEPGEGCDDGANVAGDGCGPTCQLEPVITPGPSPQVAVFCGDGLVTGAELCDDGNTTSGDGCSSACAVEDGFTCDDDLALPNSVQMRVTYRDFKSGNASAGGGHPDFQYKPLLHVAGIAGAPCTTANTGSCGRLDADGKPVLAVNDRPTTGIQSADTFSLWFRSTNPGGIAGANGAILVSPFQKTLTLSQAAPGSEVYTYESSAFFPLGGSEGFGALGSEVSNCTTGGGGPGVTNLSASPACCDCDETCKSRNFGFSSELRYFFQYQGGETLEFRGDDDVWVFVNGRLAVDVGGMHEVLYGRVVLGDDGTGGGTDSNCSGHALGSLPATGTCYTEAEQADAADSRFDLIKGEVYEIVLFHAERHSYASNFRLTLSGFLAPRSFCEPVCGDGKVVAGEACDDGEENEDGVSGVCNTTCTALQFCGDDAVQTGEACDNGVNLDLYVSGATGDQCAPGCVLPPKCGDGAVQAGFEQCDEGGSNSDASYGPESCTTSCVFGSYCGDGTKDGPEFCDLGADNGGYGPGSCGYDCLQGPYCGDEIRNGTEACDGTEKCSETCTQEPYCGNYSVDDGEECDYGAAASEPDEYDGCTPLCERGPYCGDGGDGRLPDKPYEECDEGEANNDGSYDGCNSDCTSGPHCGDGVWQSSEGEACDNAYNDDTYAYSDGACGPDCTALPHCGDGQIDSAYELCDDGAGNSNTTYEACTETCEWGPYCGDGQIDPEETCDDGLDNAAYSPNGAGCGYDCEPAAYCGDGERNGPEQCDLGTLSNDGSYAGCNENCTRAPYCGDREVSSGEACDDGPTGSLSCSSSCERREVK